MSQTIRIGEPMGFPEVSAVPDVGPTIDISNINDFDIGLLGNQKKLSMAPSSQSIGISAPSMDLKEVDNIEFVSLEDTNVTYDVKPPANSGDTIKILRDNSPPRSEMRLKLNPEPALASSTAAPAAAPAAASAPAPPTAAVATTATTTTANTGSSGNNWFGFGSKPADAPASSSGISGWFSSAAQKPAEPAATYLTPEQESAKKMEGLTMLERMDRKGIGGTKMTVANSLDEINAEVARRKDSKGLEASLRFQRSMMTTVTSGLEFLNNRYDPLGVNLDGWSEQINENIEDYDEIFEELYDKYKDKTKVAPEVRLVMSLGLSAAMCHLTNTMFKSRMPGMDDILRKNPELARQMARAAAEQAVGPGFANFMSMAPNSASGAGPSRPMPPMSSMPPTMMSEPPSMDEEPPTMMFMPPMGSGIGAPVPSADPRDSNGASTARREMRGPTGVDDILRTLETAGQAPNRTTPAPAIDAEELSVGSGVTTETQRRAGISRRRKATVSQPMGSTLTLNV